MNPYKEAWWAFIWFYQIIHRAFVMDDPKYEKNVIFIQCSKCRRDVVHAIIQKEGMSFTCDFCGHLIFIIKKGEFDKLIVGLEKAAEQTPQELS